MKKFIIALLVILLLAGGAAGGAYAYLNQFRQKEGFLKGTVLNGQDIEGMTVQQAADLVTKDYEKNLTVVLIKEDGEPAISGTLEEFGYTFDRDLVVSMLERRMAAQKEDIFSVIRVLRNGDEIVSSTKYQFNEDTLKSYAVSSSLPVPRVETVDPEMKFSKKKQLYYVVEGSEGNCIDDALFQAFVKETIDAALAEGPQETIEMSIPESVYSSVPPADTMEQLEAEALQKNKDLRLSEYENVKITYQFGSETQVLDYSTVKDWLLIDDDFVVTIDESKIAEYVDTLAEDYNTWHHARTFVNTNGETVNFEPGLNEYGYTIDEEAEEATLKANIEGKGETTREPVYIQANSYGNPYYYARNGRDDLCGTYVECDLTRQHMWFYIDGQLIVESDFISGDISKNHGTQVGVFPLAYKESPSILRGEDAEDGYETKVQYWMPFFEGQGLHDASWQPAFGGQIYQYNGSHGCINLPPSVAATVYENIRAGMAIVIFY